MITIINYGSGNVQAIANIYKRHDIDYIVTNDLNTIRRSTKLILPGVGAFDETMALLNASGITDALNEAVLVKKIPIIGVCVGMQILGESSEEGVLAGLGWIKGSIKKIDNSLLKTKPELPHLGWNNIKKAKEHPLLDGIDEEKGFYFLHSYYFQNDVEDNCLATVNYGKSFTCVVQNENVYGVQFHPEKSHTNGVTIFKNFAKI